MLHNSNPARPPSQSQVSGTTIDRAGGYPRCGYRARIHLAVSIRNPPARLRAPDSQNGGTSQLAPQPKRAPPALRDHSQKPLSPNQPGWPRLYVAAACPPAGRQDHRLPDSQMQVGPTKHPARGLRQPSPTTAHAFPPQLTSTGLFPGHWASTASPTIVRQAAPPFGARPLTKRPRKVQPPPSHRLVAGSGPVMGLTTPTAAGLWQSTAPTTGSRDHLGRPGAGSSPGKPRGPAASGTGCGCRSRCRTESTWPP